MNHLSPHSLFALCAQATDDYLGMRGVVSRRQTLQHELISYLDMFKSVSKFENI
jgi:hypothetical protein